MSSTRYQVASGGHYVPSNHFLCGNYGIMLIMSRICRASGIMSVLNPIHITLSHALKFTAGALMAMIPSLPHCGIGSIVWNMPRSCSSSSNRDGMLLRLQGYEQWSFVESIDGEETPATGDCITVPTRYGDCIMVPTRYGFDGEESSAASDRITLHQYGLNSYVFHAVLSGETNECQRPLDSCIFHAVPPWETDEHQSPFPLPCTTLHLMPHQYLVTAHSMQHGQCISWHSIASYPLRLDFMCL